MRDAKGNRILLQRDGPRNLRRLVSPSGRTIDFQYDDQSRITEARDDQGHRVAYSYDPAGRLATVTHAQRQITRFTYDRDMMLTIEDGRGHILLRNSYEDGRISKQIAADGSIYHYHYTLDRDDQVVKTLVVSPEGVESALTFDHGMLVGRTASRGL